MSVCIYKVVKSVQRLLVLVIESLQVLVHGLQLSVKGGKSFVPSLRVGKPSVPHQHELLLVLHFLCFTASLANCLNKG